MTYQERQAIGNLLAGIIIFSAYFFWVWRAIDGGLLGTETEATTIGRGILVLIYWHRLLLNCIPRLSLLSDLQSTTGSTTISTWIRSAMRT